jgi:hypothetical protein
VFYIRILIFFNIIHVNFVFIGITDQALGMFRLLGIKLVPLSLDVPGVFCGSVYADGAALGFGFLTSESSSSLFATFVIIECVHFMQYKQ